MGYARSTEIQNGCDMLYLAVCALNNRIPEDSLVRAMDLPAVYQLAKDQQLAAITCHGVELWLAEDRSSRTVEVSLWTQWKNTKKRVIYKNLMLDTEREKLIGFLESRGIWYMLLKGSIIKGWYPQPDMRQMCDNDILFDPAFREDVARYMAEQGFVFTEEAGSVHDVYTKHPGCVFEMHLRLFGYTASPRWRAYYEDVKSRLVTDGENPFRYRFTDEDMYVYMVTHSSKHYNLKGHGLRNLLDVCVFLQKKPCLQWTYVEEELEKLGLLEHEKVARSLAIKLLSMPGAVDPSAFNGQEEEMFLACLTSGAYGNRRQRVVNEIHKISKQGRVSLWDRVRYLLRRAIPDMELIEMLYPATKKHKVLVPFCVLHRAVVSLQRPKRIWAEIKTLFKTKE